MIYYIGHKLTW